MWIRHIHNIIGRGRSCGDYGQAIQVLPHRPDLVHPLLCLSSALPRTALRLRLTSILEHPPIYPVSNTALVDPLRPTTLHTRPFSWQSHMGRCGGDGKCIQSHEVVKLAVKRLVMCNLDPCGIAIPFSQLLFEAIHLRS
jgi:hypothetical protein